MNKFSKEKIQLVNELHKPVYKNFKRRKVLVNGLNDLIQVDLVEMIPFSKINKGYKYILTVINVFSKYAWAIPVKNKTGKDVTEAMRKILTSINKIKNVQSDLGKEFYNANFQALMKQHGINHYSTYSSLKASVVERFNRTLKNAMYKYFSLQGSYKWVHILPELVATYNNTKHRTIQMRPRDVNKSNEQEILKTHYSNLKILAPRKFNVNDKVRISKSRGVFSRGYLPNFSTEVFTIKKVQNTNPATYLLTDERNNDIKGGFYEQELQKTANPDVFLVERVLKRKGNNIYVKWLGFDSSYNSWIPKKNLV